MVRGHVDEIDLAGLRVAAAVGEHEVNHRVRRVRRAALCLTQVENLALRYRKACVDRVLRDDGGERAARRADEIADRERRASDAAGEGRGGCRYS